MDKAYWDNYYKNSAPTLEPSPFAVKVAEQYLHNRQGRILELGCGNGRDSLYFGKLGMAVTAVDESSYAIEMLKNKLVHSNIQFLQGDFVQFQTLGLTQYDYCYSRFTLHSITEEQEGVLFQNIWNALDVGGLFLVEARSVLDEIYGKGEEVGKNSYIYNGHFRRFLVLEELVSMAKKIGFQIEFADQQRDWAVFGQENPIVIRLVLRKSAELAQ